MHTVKYTASSQAYQDARPLGRIADGVGAAFVFHSAIGEYINAVGKAERAVHILLDEQ